MQKYLNAEPVIAMRKTNMSEIDGPVCSAFRQALTTAMNDRPNITLENQVMIGKWWRTICEDAEHFLCVIESQSDEEE